MGKTINGIDVDKAVEILRQANEDKEFVSKISRWGARVR